ncbi:MAG TPA: ATP-binding cassette domain-containing protein [Gammaproteobacteria bacterium]|nr:ATP-binding cassette domain-containing protein [Gammaproteobacteria bacterium]
MLAVFQQLQDSAQLLKPYFTDHKNASKNKWLFFGFLVGNILQAVVIAVLYTYMSLFIGIFAMPVLSYALLFSTLAECSFALLAYTATSVVNNYLTTSLKYSLSESLNADLSAQWLRNQNFYGIKQPGNNTVYPDKVLSEDSITLVKKSIDLLQLSFNVAFGFIIGVYRLFALSVVTTITVFNREIAIPGLMAIGSIGYALVYNLISARVSNSLTAQVNVEKEKSGHMQKVMDHIDANHGALAMQNAAHREQGFYNHAFNDLKDAKLKVLNTTTKLDFLSIMNESLSVLVGLILAAPSIIAKKIDATSMLEINHYVSDIIKFFTVKYDNIHDITQLETSVQRINEFKKAMATWEKSYQKNQHFTSPESSFSVSNLTIKNPRNETLLDKVNVTFEKGKITLLKGESGCGKSTLLRTLAGLWPKEGTYSLPFKREEIAIIPQTPCFPFRSKLIEAIAENPESINRDQLKAYMNELELSHLIPYLDKEGSWSTVSGGERQRLAILGILTKTSQPKLVFLDESTSALDIKLKAKTEDLIKRVLKNTTILAVDHNPEHTAKFHKAPFYDTTVEFRNKKLHTAHAPSNTPKPVIFSEKHPKASLPKQPLSANLHPSYH